MHFAHFVSYITVIKDNGTTDKQTKTSFNEKATEMAIPMMNVAIDWMMMLSGKPMACAPEKFNRQTNGKTSKSIN